ncbi:hypothetical protein AX17_005436 [Amanita inopinata Kibby_2008]|nr:hypothetical protein AX17_005436 [Amanita inopinata Kibby_2008]
MAVFVVGYYLNFASTRALMKILGIDTRDVEDESLSFPINNWLAENEKRHILAGAIIHPSRQKDRTATEDGILFMSGFYKKGHYKIPGFSVEETDDDRKVKEWLINEGGANSEELEWMQMWDEFCLTLCGFVPTKNDVKGRAVYKIVSPQEFLELMTKD